MESLQKNFTSIRVPTSQNKVQKVECVYSNDSPVLKKDHAPVSHFGDVPFEDILKLGSKGIRTVILGEREQKSSSSTAKRKSESQNFKRENKNRPRETGVRRKVRFLGGAYIDSSSKNSTFRDPRFDMNCGVYDSQVFRKNFSFLTELRDKELKDLIKELKSTNDEKERKRLKFLIQRMKNKILEEQKLRDRETTAAQYKTKSEQKAHTLVKQYVELKESGRIDKHLQKRRKKNISRDRKKLNFD